MAVKLGKMKDCCYDCGLSYGDPKFPDLLVPNNVWELINPTEHKGAGLLCSNCIVGRCEKLGLENVPFLFTSGPFAYGIDLGKEFLEREKKVRKKPNLPPSLPLSELYPRDNGVDIAEAIMIFIFILASIGVFALLLMPFV